MTTAPTYVLVGHVTRDITDDGFVIGGTVAYAGLTAVSLGCTVGAVTSAASGLDLADRLPGIDFCVQPAPATTTFENIYRGGHRQQWIRGIAGPLDQAQVPCSWRSAPIVHLAPLVGEFGSEMISAFEHCQLLGLTPQGWLRTWDDTGFVQRSAWNEPLDVLDACDAVVLSEEDVDGDWATLRRLASVARLLVVTQGSQGCTVYDRARGWQVPAFPAIEADATGAGDVFAAAFFVGFLKAGDPVNAAHFANCVASFAVEASGTSGIPTTDAVAERLATRLPAVEIE